MDFKSEDQLYAWAGGLFDGEGTISIDKNKIRVAVVMTDFDILETFKLNFGGSLIEQTKRVDYYKDQWRWSLTNNQESCLFLTKILPFLHSRRTLRAQEAIALYKELITQQELKIIKRTETQDIIRELRKNGLTHKNIAIKLNVDRSYVTHVLNGDYD